LVSSAKEQGLKQTSIARLVMPRRRGQVGAGRNIWVFSAKSLDCMFYYSAADKRSHLRMLALRSAGKYVADCRRVKCIPTAVQPVSGCQGLY